MSEASRRLPQELKDLEAGIPWRAIAGIGNIHQQTLDAVGKVDPRGAENYPSNCGICGHPFVYTLRIATLRRSNDYKLIAPRSRAVSDPTFSLIKNMEPAA